MRIHPPDNLIKIIHGRRGTRFSSTPALTNEFKVFGCHVVLRIILLPYRTSKTPAKPRRRLY